MRSELKVFCIKDQCPLKNQSKKLSEYQDHISICLDKKVSCPN